MRLTPPLLKLTFHFRSVKELATKKFRLCLFVFKFCFTLLSQSPLPFIALFPLTPPPPGETIDWGTPQVTSPLHEPSYD